MIPVCPEQLGGLPTPRPSAERQGARVVTQQGSDVTAQYRRGAEEALRLALLFGCEASRAFLTDEQWQAYRFRDRYPHASVVAVCE